MTQPASHLSESERWTIHRVGHGGFADVSGPLVPVNEGPIEVIRVDGRDLLAELHEEQIAHGATLRRVDHLSQLLREAAADENANHTIGWLERVKEALDVA